MRSTTEEAQMRMAHEGAAPPPRALPTTGSIRRPWEPWLLAVITFGVYAAIQHYRVNRELRDFGIDVDPVKALLAFVPGAVLVVPYLVTTYRTCERIRVTQETVGLAPTIRPILGTVASLFACLHIPYQQSELNRAWTFTGEAR